MSIHAFHKHLVGQELKPTPHFTSSARVTSRLLYVTMCYPAKCCCSSSTHRNRILYVYGITPIAIQGFAPVVIFPDV